MSDISRILNQKLNHSLSKTSTILYIALFPVACILSILFVGNISDVTPDTPGGNYLEISFWMTSIASAFLSFIITDLLFRGDTVHFLAPLPVSTQSLFRLHLRSIFKGIALSSLPYLAFWAPHLNDAPSIVLMCILLMPIGLSICAAISLATLLYMGNVASHKTETASNLESTLGYAPAISLAISISLTLILKLLAEALLKPAFMNAALTALVILSASFILAFFYARRSFNQSYYQTLAIFYDYDSITINANYDFIGNKQIKAIRTQKSASSAISYTLSLQYKRQHPMASTAIIISMFIIMLASFYLPHTWLPALILIPILGIGRPWNAIHNSPFYHDWLASQPIPHDQLLTASRTSIAKLSFPTLALATLASAFPSIYSDTPTLALTYASFTLIAGTFAIAIITYMTEHHPTKSNAISYIMTAIMAIIAIIM